MSHGNVGDRRQQRIQLRGRRTIPFHLTVRLLEHETRRQRQRSLGRIPPTEKARENQHPFGVNGTAQLHFPLDVHDLPLPQPDAGGDPVGLAEDERAEFDDRQAVDLSHLRSIRIDVDRPAPDLLLDTVS